MDEIKSALIVGAGAVGASIASIIYAKEPSSLRVLADEARSERFRREGFTVNGRRFDFPLAPARARPPRGEEPDLVIVAVKCHQLASAIADMQGYVGPDTLILSLLNGITSEDELAAAFGREKVTYAMIIGIDAVREGRETSFASTGRIHFGDERNEAGRLSKRVSRIASFFDRAGIAYAIPEDMIRSLWYKLMVNVGINQASAVLGASYGLFHKSAEAREAMESAMREVVAVSQALGTGLMASDIETWEATLAGLSPDAKTSMLQDVEAGRKTEVEAFAGTIVELGKKAGVATPVNELLFNLIRAIESRRP
jgi:2-dehydropantoate 2-reductase